MSKKYTDISVASNRVSLVDPADSIFAALLKETIRVIDELSLFRYVGVHIRDKDTIITPSCVIFPGGVSSEQALTGGTLNKRYTVGVAVALKHPNDAIIMQMALDYIECVSDRFRYAEDSADEADRTKNILLFNSIAGHYNTEVLEGNFGDTVNLGDNILAFNAGLNIVYSVDVIK